MTHDTVTDRPKVGDTRPADGPPRTLQPTDRQIAELALHEARQTRKLLEAMATDVVAVREDVAEIREVLDEVSVLIDEAAPLMEGLAKGGLSGIMGALMGGGRG